MFSKIFHTIYSIYLSYCGCLNLSYCGWQREILNHQFYKTVLYSLYSIGFQHVSTILLVVSQRFPGATPRRRHMICLELPWAADKAVQQLGRVWHLRFSGAVAVPYGKPGKPMENHRKNHGTSPFFHR